MHELFAQRFFHHCLFSWIDVRAVDTVALCLHHVREDFFARVIVESAGVVLEVELSVLAREHHVHHKAVRFQQRVARGESSRILK